jgi:hypothetical protein
MNDESMGIGCTNGWNFQLGIGVHEPYFDQP